MSDFIQKYRISLVKDGRVKFNPDVVVGSSQLADIARSIIKDSDREMFIVIMLDGKNAISGINVVSVGSLTASIVHPREVFKPAILCNSDAVAFAHNHPSGLPEPSFEDIQITDRLVKAGNILGIRVLDHVVIGEDSYISFHERGLLPDS